MSFLELMFLFLVAHAVADFSLQTDIMAKGKNRNNKTTPPPDAKYFPCWPYWLSAHALIHGGGVFLVSGSVYLGMAETAAHWATDYFKCENKIGVNQDQFLHITVKVIYAIVLVA